MRRDFNCDSHDEDVLDQMLVIDVRGSGVMEFLGVLVAFVLGGEWASLLYSQ